MTAAVIAEKTRLHQEATQVYRTYHNVDRATKKLIIETFDDTCLNAVSEKKWVMQAVRHFNFLLTF
jgi:hypothetical protein